MDTEQIMEIAEDYADAAADHAHECSTPNELTLLLNRRAALQVAIEALAQERDSANERLERMGNMALRVDETNVKLAAECKTLRDALCKELVDELVGAVCHGDEALTRKQP